MTAIKDIKISKTNAFTLIELLVVISIIAVLSVIGITVFTYVQKSARDSARKADIDAIAKVLEVNQNPVGTYIPLNNNQFVSGSIPIDPINTGIYRYRGATANPWGNPNICAQSNINGNLPLSDTLPVPAPAPSNTNRWTICACLENETDTNGNPLKYCKSNAR